MQDSEEKYIKPSVPEPKPKTRGIAVIEELLPANEESDNDPLFIQDPYERFSGAKRKILENFWNSKAGQTYNNMEKVFNIYGIDTINSKGDHFNLIFKTNEGRVLKKDAWIPNHVFRAYGYKTTKAFKKFFVECGFMNPTQEFILNEITRKAERPVIIPV